MLLMLLPLKLNDCFVTLFRQWHASFLSPVMSTPICWCILQTVDSISLFLMEEGIPTTSTRSCRERWTFFQHCHLINEICSARTLLTFLTTETYDCSFWKFLFKRLISSVGEAIVGLVYPGDFRNRSIFWFLFNTLSVSKVYTQTIVSTRLLPWQKIVVK